MSTNKPDLATALIHHAYEPPAGFVAPQPAVHKASTVIFPDTAALRARNWKSKAGYTYGLRWRAACRRCWCPADSRRSRWSTWPC